MSTPNPKTKITESLREMELPGRKITNEFQIHKWKVAAKASSSSVEKNRILGIIAAYENYSNISKKYFDQAIKESGGNSYIVIDDYVKCLMMLGDLSSATDQLIKLIELNINQNLIDDIMTFAMTRLDEKPLEILLTKLKESDDNNDLIISLEKFYKNIIDRQDEYKISGLSMEIFRILMDLVHEVFYKKFVGTLKYNYFGSLKSEIGLKLMLQPEALTPQDIAEVNDDLVDGIVRLSEKYDILDLTKLTIYFSSRKSNSEIAA